MNCISDCRHIRSRQSTFRGHELAGFGPLSHNEFIGEKWDAGCDGATIHNAAEAKLRSIAELGDSGISQVIHNLSRKAFAKPAPTRTAYAKPPSYRFESEQNV